eukprot:356606-Chlamydomonas_euryale.AAC.1
MQNLVGPHHRPFAAAASHAKSGGPTPPSTCCRSLLCKTSWAHITVHFAAAASHAGEPRRAGCPPALHNRPPDPSRLLLPALFRLPSSLGPSVTRPCNPRGRFARCTNCNAPHSGAHHAPHSGAHHASHSGAYHAPHSGAYHAPHSVAHHAARPPARTHSVRVPSQIVELLVEEGSASVDLSDRWGHNPYDNAVAAGAVPVVEYLRPIMEIAEELRAATVEQRRVGRWLSAAARNDLGEVNAMLAQNININVTSRTHGGRTALMIAAEAGYQELLLRLLDAGAAPVVRDISGFTALFYAVRTGNEDLVALLVDNGVKLCMDEQLVAYQLCRMAADDANLQQLRCLLAAGAPAHARLAAA